MRRGGEMSRVFVPMHARPYLEMSVPPSDPGS